jgi:hypothetical protein
MPHHTLDEVLMGKATSNINLSAYAMGLSDGAKWQQEKTPYSEEDMRLAFETGRNYQLTGEHNFAELLEQLQKRTA